MKRIELVWSLALFVSLLWGAGCASAPGKRTPQPTAQPKETSVPSPAAAAELKVTLPPGAAQPPVSFRSEKALQGLGDSEGRVPVVARSHLRRLAELPEENGWKRDLIDPPGLETGGFALRRRAQKQERGSRDGKAAGDLRQPAVAKGYGGQAKRRPYGIRVELIPSRARGPCSALRAMPAAAGNTRPWRGWKDLRRWHRAAPCASLRSRLFP